MALKLLDEVGLDGLTMRSLADRLGVKAASLYWHLRDKDELADLLVDAINAELPEPEPGLPWREQVERQMWEWRQVLLAHRDAARLAMGRFVTRPVTLRRIELVLAALRRAGFRDQDVANAGYLLSNFVPGFVVEETMARRAAAVQTPAPGAVPASALDRARLEIGWARRLIITADPSLLGLYRVHSEGRMPDVQAGDGVVTLHQTHGRKPATLALNALIGWEIQVRGGAAQLTADLRGLGLSAFSVAGGASALELTLPLPSGTVPIRLTGGTSKLTIHRPAEVPVRLEVRGGISRLTFDHRPFRSAGELTVQSPGYDRVDDRFAVTLTGGVSRVVVDAEMPARPPAGSPALVSTAPPSAEAADYPTLNALAGRLLETSMDARFRFGLQVLLDGLERRLS